MFIRYCGFMLKIWDFNRLDGYVPEDQISEASGITMVCLVAESMDVDFHADTCALQLAHKDPEQRELIIQGLASLVSANTEFGVKHCLPMAYDSDSLKQTIFTHVFARVLGKGIKLSPREDPSNGSRQSKLCEVSRCSSMPLSQ